MLNLSKFSERLGELLFDNDLRPPALAKNIGIDRTTITRYLSGNKIPSLAVVIKLADYFCCSTDFLLALEEANYSKVFKQCPPFRVQLPILLKYFNVTKYGLQKQTQIPESAIYNWLRGDYTPTVDNVIRIATCLGCSVDFVLGRGG